MNFMIAYNLRNFWFCTSSMKGSRSIAVLCPVLVILMSFYLVDFYLMCGKDVVADIVST